MKPQTVKKLLKLNYDLYESQALDWDKTRSAIWEKPILDFIDKIKPKSSILDLGCGNGRLCDCIAKHGLSTRFNSGSKQIKQLKIKYVGIDISKKFIELNKKKYPISHSESFDCHSEHSEESQDRLREESRDPSTSLKMTAEFKVGDSLTVNFKNRFDYIISIAVLHHIPSKELQLKFLRNIYQALKPKGKILISVWNRWQPRYKKYFIPANPKHEIPAPKQARYGANRNPKLRKYPRQSASLSALISDLEKCDTIVPWKQSGKFRFIHCFTAEELKKLAKQTGFKDIKTFYADKTGESDKENGLNIYLIGEKNG